jgi:predicted SprT family Zn-dependent metalloprotease
MARFNDEALATRAGRVAGEAGIAHLRAPLAGIRFESRIEMEVAVSTIFETLQYKLPAGHTDVVWPKFKVNNRFGKPGGIHGRYHPRTQHIEVAPLFGLATALHELAHHINFTYHGGRGHDKGFKRICGNLYKAAADHYGLKSVRSSSVSLVGKRPRHGQMVRIDHPKFRGQEFKVTKVNRTRAVCQSGTGSYAVPFRMITPLEVS